jgi:hypothetical protein
MQAGKEVKKSVYIFVNGKILRYSFQKRYCLPKQEYNASQGLPYQLRMSGKLNLWIGCIKHMGRQILSISNTC